MRTIYARHAVFQFVTTEAKRESRRWESNPARYLGTKRSRNRLSIRLRIPVDGTIIRRVIHARRTRSCNAAPGAAGPVGTARRLSWAAAVTSRTTDTFQKSDEEIAQAAARWRPRSKPPQGDRVPASLHRSPPRG